MAAGQRTQVGHHEGVSVVLPRQREREGRPGIVSFTEPSQSPHAVSTVITASIEKRKLGF